MLFDHIHSPSRILDVGCGVGNDVLDLYGSGYVDVYGLDVNEDAVRVAAATAVQRGYRVLEDRFVEADAEAMPFPDEYFDCIITKAFWTSILSGERDRVICEVSRVLRDDGILFATFWDQCWDVALYRRRYIDAIAQGLEKGSFEVKHKATGDVLYVAHHYTKDEVKLLLAEGGLCVAKYDRKLERTQSGNLVGCHTVIAKVRPCGLAPGSIKRIELDGNDGTGKTTLCAMLRTWGVEASDRGLATEISLGNARVTDLRDDTLYIILDVEPEVSHSRLAKAGEDMSKEFHTLRSLERYRSVYRDIYTAANRANVVLVDAGGPPWDVARRTYVLAKGRLRNAVSPALDGLAELVLRA